MNGADLLALVAIALAAVGWWLYVREHALVQELLDEWRTDAQNLNTIGLYTPTWNWPEPEQEIQ